MEPDPGGAPRYSLSDLVEAVDRERERTARILHDSLCQTLGALALTAQLVERGIARGQSAGEVQEYGGQLGELTRESLHQAQNLALSLQGPDRPEPDKWDLVAALEVYLESSNRLHPCSLTVAGNGANLSAVVSFQLLRIVQEAVELAREAGGTEETIVTLRMAPDVVRLEVQSGGIEAAEPGGGDPFSRLGLMRLRADALGAQLEVTEGSVTCKVPLPDSTTPSTPLA